MLSLTHIKSGNGFNLLLSLILHFHYEKRNWKAFLWALKPSLSSLFKENEENIVSLRTFHLHFPFLKRENGQKSETIFVSFSCLSSTLRAVPFGKKKRRTARWAQREWNLLTANWHHYGRINLFFLLVGAPMKGLWCQPLEEKSSSWQENHFSYNIFHLFSIFS